MSESLQLNAADEALLNLALALRDSGYRFTTVTPATHERVNQRSGNQWASDLEGVFGWSRAFRAELLPPHIWDLMNRANVAVPEQQAWRSSVRFSTLQEQLFLHSAYPTTQADAVFFGPDTYRFATSIENYLAFEAEPVRRAIEIGCGAGPGAILIALAQPNAQILATDINEEALRFTRINARLAETANVEPLRSNLLADVAGSFDLIVANPPYLVDPAERTYRHGGGLLGAGLSLDIVDAACERLAPGGTLLLYTGTAIVQGVDRFHKAIKTRLAAANVRWSYREVDPDVFGEELLTPAYENTDRIAAVVLTMTRRA